MELKTNVSPTAHPAHGGLLQGHRVGYVRVSSFDQNPERQLEQAEVSKLFTDKASGKDTQRPQLEAMLGFVREGDTGVVRKPSPTSKPPCCGSGPLPENQDDLIRYYTFNDSDLSLIADGGAMPTASASPCSFACCATRAMRWATTLRCPSP
jgi:hypothetical protein